MRTLYIVRGLPDSGKSSIGRILASPYYDGPLGNQRFASFANDDLHTDEFGVYRFDPSKQKAAVLMCQNYTEEAMRKRVPRVSVCNTFTLKKYMEPYYKLAAEYGYVVVCVQCEGNNSGHTNGHNVPAETVKNMAAKWEPLRGH